MTFLEWLETGGILAGGAAIRYVWERIDARKKARRESEEAAARVDRMQIENVSLIQTQLKTALEMSAQAIAEHAELQRQLRECELRCAERDVKIAINTEQIHRLELRIQHLETEAGQ